MKLAILGASGQTGRLVVDRAVDKGHQVIAGARQTAEIETGQPGATAIRTDVTDLSQVRTAVRGSDAVISCIGAPGYTKDRVTIYSEGTATIIQAMKEEQVSRLVCVSTTGVNSHISADETWLYRRIVMPMLLRMGRTGYEDNALMEQIVHDSDVSATIVRAGGLFDSTDSPTTYEVRDPEDAGRFTARSDLAEALVGLAADHMDGVRTVGVFTTSGTPRLRDVLLREAFGRSTR